MKRLFLALAFSVFAGAVFAQSDDSVVIAEDVELDIPVSDFSALNDTVYTAEEIAKSEPLNLTDVFSSNGFFTRDYGSYGLESKPAIRGFTNGTVRVMLNGVCMNSPQGGTFDFTTISPFSFSTVSLVKGGFSESTRDIDAVGGTIYLSTAAPIDDERQIVFDTFALTYFNKNHVVDTFGTSALLSLPLPYSKLTFASKFTQAENAHWYKYEGEWHERVGSEVQDESFSLDWHFRKGSFDSDSFVQFYYGDKSTPGTSSWPESGKQIDLNLRAIEDFSWEIGSFLVLGNTSYLLERRSYKDSYSDSLHWRNVFSQYLAGKWSSENLSEELGLTFKFSRVDSTDDGSHIQLPISVSSLTKWMFTSRQGLSLNLGFKYCHPNFAFLPKLGYELTFKDEGSFYANIYAMSRFPTIDELYWTYTDYSDEYFHYTYTGNPDLKPEHGFGVELGYKASDTFFVPFSVSIYSNYYKDKIRDETNSLGDASPQNIDAAIYLGGELSVSKALFNDSLLLKGNYSFIWASAIEDGKVSKNQLAYTPMHSGSVSVAYTTDLLDTSLSLSCVGKRPVSPDEFLDPYFLLDFSLSYTGFEMVTPYLIAKNLLNATYETTKDYPCASPSLRLGVRVDLK
ncbi:MAG: TonB-dependent receptor [Treponema sp.]|nr:TonB-dependent receptor [Treponema sp.]